MKNKIKKVVLNILKYFFLSIGILFILSGLYLIILDTAFKNKFYPRTSILGENVTGKNYSEVRNKLYGKLNDFNEKIIFEEGDFKKEVEPENIGIEIYLDNTIESAFNYGRETFTLKSIEEKFTLLARGRSYGLDYFIKKENFNNFVRSELEPLGVTSSDINFEKSGDNLEITLGKQGRSLDKDALDSKLNKKIKDLSSDPIQLNFVSLYSQIGGSNLEQVKENIKKIVSSKFILKFENKNWEIGEDLLKDWLYFKLEDQEIDGGFYARKISVDLDRKKVGNFLETLASEIEIKPENARFQVKENKIEVSKPSIVGRDLLVEANFEELKEKVKTNDRILELKTKEIGAEINQENIDNFGIKELVGSGSSNFAGSPRNRIHNINVAVEKLNGIIVGPQNEFSLVENIGEVNAEAGYLPELVIKENKTIPEYGGGLCQIATTLFRAAIYSGFNITERQSHSYAVSYYNPQGIDATIYIPHPDLRFINDTDHSILVQAKIEGYNLIFEFYGTKDNREISVEGPFYWDRKGDGSFKARFTQVVKMPDGAERREEFKSYYDSPDKYH